MVVQHNMTAMNSNRMLGVTVSAQAKNTEKLSSGYKINRAADDAAGLTISEKMRSQIRGLTQASTNAQDGISCVQTAEGALGEVEDMLQRMHELAIKASNGTNTTADRIAIQKEINSLVSEIDRVQESSEFNTMKLLNGDFSSGRYLQVGANDVAEQRIGIKITKMSASKLGIAVLKNSAIVTAAEEKGISSADRKKNIADAIKEAKEANDDLTDGISYNQTSKIGIVDSSGGLAQKAIKKIVEAISIVSAQRSDLGAVQNRLEHTIKNLDNIVENTTAAESQIRDTDMASMMVEFTKSNILQQAGQSMLAQANQSTQGVLSLLG